MTLAYWIVTVLSSKLMGGEKRTFPKRSAWGKKLIKALVFQPEQDRTNQSLRRSPLHLELGHAALVRWPSSPTRRHGKLQTAPKLLRLRQQRRVGQSAEEKRKLSYFVTSAQN